MRNLLKYFMVILFISILVACGQNDNAEESSSTKESESSNGDVQGVTDDKILVGTSAPQTGPVAIYDNVRKGMQSYLDYVNENDGVNGREIEMIAYDDEYQPAKTLQNVQQLVEEDKVFALLGPLGTANINAAEPLLLETGIPVVGLATGANKFVNPAIRNIFATTFNYKVESIMLADYAINQLNAKSLTLVYQNDDFGIDNLESAQEALKKYPEVEVIDEIPFLASDTNFSSHTQKILDASADVIIVFATPGPAAQLRKEMYKRDETDTPFIVNTTGGADLNQFEVAGAEAWEGVITTTHVEIDESEVPDYDLYFERITNDFTEDEIGSLTQQGWSIAKIFVEAIDQLGDDLTWDSLISQLETFDDWQESFFTEITYTPEHRHGASALYVVEATDNNLSILEEMYYDPDTEEVTYK